MDIIKKILIPGSVLPIIGGTIVGCASIEKASLSSDHPETAIQEVNELKLSLIDSHVDLMAPSLFEDGVDHLEEAKEDLSEGDNSQEIIEDVAFAKAYFQKAKETAAGISPQDNLLTTRKQTFSQRTSNSPELMDRFYEIDEDWRDWTDDFSEKLTADEYANLQRRYLDLEVAFVQERELSTVRAQLEHARSSDMGDLAPVTLDRLERELKVAENLISANVRAPEKFSKSVKRAHSASNLMAEVMEEFDSRGEDTSEQVILALVAKNRKISIMNKSMEDLELEMINSEVDAMALGSELAYTSEKLSHYKDKLDYQRAMNRVRSEFDDKNVAVFRQGDALVIRMKNIKFDVGSAEIPSRAHNSLDKVRDIVKDFGAQKVIVQGHTDSTGSDALNKTLSEKRAKAVASYIKSEDVEGVKLQSVGLGEAKPIVSNNTEAGRAKNRRVDIIIKTRG